jgi:hypothetical protein
VRTPLGLTPPTNDPTIGPETRRGRIGTLVVTAVVVSLLVFFAVMIWRGDAPSRAFDRCMASRTAQLQPGEYLVDGADCQPLLRGQP